jgi:hypothetical protein
MWTITGLLIILLRPIPKPLSPIIPPLLFVHQKFKMKITDIKLYTVKFHET